MANNTTTHVMRGTLHWAKVLGEPRMNTFAGERQWSVDVTPDAEGLKEMKRLGILGKLKTPKDTDDRKEGFIGFRQNECRTDAKTGERLKNHPIKIVDARNDPWPENKLIGNGSIADVKYTIRDYGPGKQLGVYIQSIRVLKNVDYVVQEFAPLSADDEFFAKDTPAAVDTSLADDDIPF